MAGAVSAAEPIDGVAYVENSLVTDPGNNYTTLNDAVKAANAATSEITKIVLKAGDHYSGGVQTIDSNLVAEQIEIKRKDLIITGEGAIGADDFYPSVLYCHNETEANSMARGLDIASGATDVTLKNFSIVVSDKSLYGAVIAAYANDFVMENCTVDLKGNIGESKYIFDAASLNAGGTHIIRNNIFRSETTKTAWTVYAGNYKVQRTGLLTFTNNTIIGNFTYGLNQIVGNYIITNNNFSLDSGSFAGIRIVVTDNESTGAVYSYRNITNNIFGANLPTAVHIYPMNITKTEPKVFIPVTMYDNMIPSITGNQIKNTSGYIVDISLVRFADYFAELTSIPQISTNTNIHSGGGVPIILSADKTHRYLAPADGTTMPLVPGVNLSGVTWTGDDTSGYTLTISKDGTYKLMSDVTLTEMSVIQNVVTLDLNGHTMSTISDMHSGANGSKDNTALLQNLGTLIITDSSSGKPGKLEVMAINNAAWNSASAVISNGGTLTIAGGNIVHKGGTDMSYAIDSLSGSSNVNLTVNGGTLRSEKYVTIRAFANSPAVWSNITITGGELIGAKRVVCIQEPSSTVDSLSYLNITGGTFKLDNTSDTAVPQQGIVVFEHYKNGTGLFADISGGTFEADPIWGMITFGDDSPKGGDGKNTTVRVTGGTFTYGGSKKAVYNVTGASNTPDKTSNVRILMGGFYLQDVTEFCAPGYATSTIQMNGKGYYAVVKGVAPSIAKDTVTTTGDGQATVKLSENEGTYDSTTNTASLSAGQGVTLNITFDGTQTGDISSGISGPVASMEVVYKDLELDTGKTVTVDVPLTSNDPAKITQILPTLISPPESTITNVDNSLKGQYTNIVLYALVEASSSNMAAFNAAIPSGGMTLTFKIPASVLGESPTFLIAHFGENGVLKEVLTPSSAVKEGDVWVVTVIGHNFSGYGVFTGNKISNQGGSGIPVNPPVYSSSDGNMENAFRVLFDTNGGSFVQPATGLSYGDRVPEPGTPTKDGYVFGGWYKDEALNILWIFKEDALPGDMTLYAKWISGSTVTASSPKSDSAMQPVAAAMQQQTTSATAAVSSAATTSPAGISPTMTQAPAPVVGMLVGLLAAGIFLRRKI
ncbi:InlB B-repeat-containing protein [Methanorbis furvi]